MRAKTPMLVALLLTLIFFSFTVNGNHIEPIGEEDDSEMVLVDPTADGDFTPGTTVDLPNPSGYFQNVRWISTVEPTAYRWVVYDPTNHIVYEDTHTPLSKYWDEDMQYWVYGDVLSFDIPAFAREGLWSAKSYVQYGGDAEEYKEPMWLFPVAGGGWYANIFEAPLYISVLGFNLKLPALFWCLSIIWIPLLIMLVLYIYARSAEGVTDIFASARDAGRRARDRWKKKRELKARQQQ